MKLERLAKTCYNKEKKKMEMGMEFSFGSFVDGSFDYDSATKTHSCIWLREERMDIRGGDKVLRT